MHDKNLSVRQVSMMTGVSKSAISRIANGQVSPTADVLEALARGLQIRISDLIESSHIWDDFKNPVSNSPFMCLIYKGNILQEIIRTFVRNCY